jgi:hypothetical protein
MAPDPPPGEKVSMTTGGRMMMKSLPMLILLALIPALSWFCCLPLGDVLASVFVAGTIILTIAPSLLRGTRTGRSPW